MGKKKKLGLVPKLIIGIILGILIGSFCPEIVCRIVVTASGLFSTFLKFVIPMMILAYVTMGIADLSQGAVLQAPTKGIQEAADVVAFVLLIGGSFAIITKTNALNAGMSRVIKKLKNKDILIIPITMTLLSICGTTFGMSEEALPFYAIFIPIMMGIGYDSMTAFIICFLGPNLGYCASTIDPFNVLIAQGIIGIEGNPQLWLRAVSWVIFTAVGIAWAMRYAMRVKKIPSRPLRTRTISSSVLSFL